MVCKIKDDVRLIPPFSVSRLQAAKRRPVGICKRRKLHHRSPPHHQRRTSRGHGEEPGKICVARTTRWDGFVRYRQSSWQPASCRTRSTLYYQPIPLTTTTPIPAVVLAITTVSSHAGLPKGRYGVASAASVAKDMLRSFESIQIGLMVGIGAGASSGKHDIRLGDIVVGCPIKKEGGVVPYSFGKAVQEQEFEQTDSLNLPPTVLSNPTSRTFFPKNPQSF